MSDIQINFSIDDPINTALTVEELGNVNLTIDSNIAANMSIDGVTYNNSYSNTASGAAGAIQFSDGNGNFSSSNSLGYDSANQLLRVLNIRNTDSQQHSIEVVDYYTGNTLGNQDYDVIIGHARGTPGSPANVQTGDDLAWITAAAYTSVGNVTINNTTGWTYAGGLLFESRSNGNVTANYSCPAHATILVGTGNGNAIISNVDSNGYAYFNFNRSGTFSASAGSFSNSLVVGGSANAGTLNIVNNANVNGPFRANSTSVFGNTITANTSIVIGNASANGGGNIAFNSPAGRNSYITGNPKVENLTFVDYTGNVGFDYDVVFYQSRGNRDNPEPVQVNDSIFVVPGFVYTGNGTMVGPDGQANGWAFSSHHMEVQIAEQPTVAGGCPSTKVRWTVSNATANNNFYKSIEFDHTGQTTLPGFTLNQGNLQVVGNITANNIGNIAPINLSGNGSQYLSGNGTWSTISSNITSISGLKYATEAIRLNTTQGNTSQMFLMNESTMYVTQSSSGNITLDLTGNSTTTLNSLLAVGQSITATYLLATANTGYVVSTLQVDGVNQTVRWPGGTAPAAYANSLISHTYTVIKTAATPTYTVLGSWTRYQ